MPDITMCASTTCTARATCYRNPESGTKPDEWRQSWFMEPPWDDEKFGHYWPRVVKS